jgi:biotin/methionine sulfoxide reductase
MVNHRLRIDRPYVRAAYMTEARRGTHARGRGGFIPLEWNHAIDLTASELERVKSEYGNQAIYGGSYGWASAGRFHHAPSLLKRFLGLFGGFVDKIGNHSYGAALGIMPHVIGRADINRLVVPWRAVVEHTELMVMFGGAPAKNMQIDGGGAVLHENARWMQRAAAANIAFVNISPSREDLPGLLKPEWIPIIPHADMPMMLGIAHSLLILGLCKEAFLASHCVGFEPFRRYLLGQDDGVAKDAAWAAALSGVSARAILDLARRMAESRTLITVSWSMQRARFGEQPVWMAVVLAAMLGQIGLPGRGFSIGFGAVNGSASSRPDDIPRPTFPVGLNPLALAVPVARVADMLLRPGETLEFDGRKIPLPDIRLIYSAGGNPFHHNSDLNRFLGAWQRPDTVIVHEHWWTPAARHADIVLPAATTLERNDILASEGQRHYVAMHRAMENFQQSRSDFDIFSWLADRLGFGSAFTEGRGEMDWLRHLYEHARKTATARGYDPPDFDRFWHEGRYEFPEPERDPVLFGDFLRDPRGHPLATPSGKIEIYSRRVASYGYDDCPGHPTWLNPEEWLGSPKAQRYPLHLLSNQPKHRLHSQLDAAPASVAGKIGGREPLLMHPQDAASRGIANGDSIRVFNDRGQFAAAAVIVDSLRRGVVQMATGAWFDPVEPGLPGSLDRHGNPNLVTPNETSSRLSQGSAAQSALVQITLFPDAPAPDPFRPPVRGTQPAR